jgi:hypothetical protein
MMAAPIPPDPDPRLPTVDDIGALLRARTQNKSDDEIGTFDDETRPTKDEVDKIIGQAASVVYGRIGSVEDDVLTCSSADDIRNQAKYLASLLAAMLVELSYFPEQVKSDRSAYEYYKEMWDDQMPMLIDAAAECRGGEVVPDQEGGGPGNASWGFPVDVGGMVGWQTKW